MNQSSEPVNPYQPSVPAPAVVTHHFTWRSAGTTLVVGTHERHELVVSLSLLSAKTIVSVDGRVVRALRYFFDPPPITVEVGQLERHRIDILLVGSVFLRSSRIDVDGVTVVPEIASPFLTTVRVVGVVVPLIAAAVAAFDYVYPIVGSDWFTGLLDRLIIGLVILLIAFIALVETVGLLRMKRGQPKRS